MCHRADVTAVRTWSHLDLDTFHSTQNRQPPGRSDYGLPSCPQHGRKLTSRLACLGDGRRQPFLRGPGPSPPRQRGGIANLGVTEFSFFFLGESKTPHTSYFAEGVYTALVESADYAERFRPGIIWSAR